MRGLASAVMAGVALTGCGDRVGQATTRNDAARGEILVAVNRGDNRIVDAAENSGRFSVVGRCLQLEVEGVAYTPVFFGPARYDAPTRSVVHGQRQFPLGTAVSVGGAPGNLSPPHLDIDPAVRAACPQRYFVMGSVSPLPPGPKPPPASPPRPAGH